MAKINSELRFIDVAGTVHALYELLEMFSTVVKLCEKADPRDIMFLRVDHRFVEPNA